MSARGSDIANHHLDNIKCDLKRHGLSQFWQISQDVTRFKTTTQVSHPVAPHRDNFMLCYLFSFAYDLVLNHADIHETQRVFPNFASKVFNKDRFVESKVSGHINKIIDSLWKIMTDFFKVDDTNTPDHFRDSIRHTFYDKSGKMHSKNRSHCLKRYAVQLLQEHLSPHVFVQRCGFMAENVHSVFTYYFNSIKQEIDCALILAGWDIKVNGVIQGGIAPDINAIKTSQEKVPVFVFMLFRRCVIINT